MADEFPTALLKHAVPSADQNRAGIKPPLNVIYAPPPLRRAPSRKKAATAPRQQRMQPAPVRQAPVQQVPRQFRKEAPDLHDAITMSSGGAIKHGKTNPWMNGEAQLPASSEPVGEEYDPFVVDPALAPGEHHADPIDIQARRNALLNELGELDAKENPDGSVMQEAALEEAEIPLQAPRLQQKLRAPGVDYGPQNLYLQKTARIQLELADGTFTIPVIDVRESRLSVLVLLSLNENATIFIPKYGTQLSLTYKDRTMQVFFPDRKSVV